MGELLTPLILSEEGTRRVLREVTEDDGEGRIVRKRIYLPSGRNVCTVTYDAAGKLQATYLHDAAQQETLGSFDVAGIADPKEYLGKLPHFLDTWEAIHAYITYCFQYEREEGDHWMTPEEFVRSTRQGQTRGDCDDVAFFVHYLWRLQGDTTSVLFLQNPTKTKGHAVYLSIWRQPDDTYHAATACNKGVDINGNHFDGPYDPAKDRGYLSKVDAVTAVLLRYRKDGYEYHLSSKPSLRLRLMKQTAGGGKDSSTYVPVDDLPHREVPAEIQVAMPE